MLWRPTKDSIFSSIPRPIPTDSKGISGIDELQEGPMNDDGSTDEWSNDFSLVWSVYMMEKLQNILENSFPSTLKQCRDQALLIGN